MVEYEFEYDIEDKVRLKAIGMDAQVDSLSVDTKGAMYRVVYWNDGSRKTDWVYGWEIEVDNEVL